MEERPWTKSEFFAWSDGRRIVDLYELSKQLHCKQCRSLLDLGRTEREARYGLASVLYILCNCGVMNDVHTGRTQQDGGGSNSPSPMYEINIKASINLLMYGAGASRILSFLALLDIPVPPPDDTSLIVPVTEDADIQNASSALGLPPSSTTTATAKSAPPAASAATSESTAPFQKPAPSSTAPSSFTPEPDFRSVPLPPRDDEDEDNDDALQEDIDNEDDENDMDDDDEEYVPTSKPKPKAKPKPTPAPKKKSLLRGPKSARAKQAAKLAAKKKAPVKLKVKIKKENVETQKKAADESEKQGDENVKQYVDPMDWSSSETETESVQGKNKGSDDSWHEDDYDGRDDEDVGSRPKRKRGRPKGSPEKGKRQRRSGSQKAKGESSSPKKTRVKAESKEVPRCTTCNKEFTSAKGYNVHMKRVHNQEMKEAEEQSEVRMEMEEADSDTDSVEVEGLVRLVTEQVKKEMYWCPACRATFSSHKSYLTHAQRSHPQPGIKEKLYLLPLIEFMAKKKLVYENGTEVTFYQCLRCQQVLRTLSLMADHMRVTVDGTLSCLVFTPAGCTVRRFVLRAVFFPKARPSYLCNTCGACLSSKQCLRVHLATRHSAVVEKTFVCEVCQASFVTRQKLHIHKEIHNPDRRKSMCGICGNIYLSEGGLLDHIDRKHKGREFPCSVCSKVFSVKRVLNDHMKTHNRDKHAVFPCSQCQLKFTKAYNLKVHMRIHSGEKPYKCDTCQAAFAQKNSLNVHMRKHGIEIQKPREGSEKETLSAPSSPSAEPKVPCEGKEEF